MDCLGFEERSSASEPFCMKGAILLVLLQSKLDVVEDNEKVQAPHRFICPMPQTITALHQDPPSVYPLCDTGGVTGWKL